MDPVFFTNFEQIEPELKKLSIREKYLRVGTGELSDSLAYDYSTGYSKIILDIMKKFPKVVFEFKTKSDKVDHILNYPKLLKNIVISWSLNPDEIVATEETHAPALDTRLNAMKKLVDRGYKIGIHFDPILIIGDWKDYYSRLIKKIRKILPQDRIAWWSLGALRFPYQLREQIFKHYGSKLFQGELIKGVDGKYRYFRPLREELFSFIKSEARAAYSQSLVLYLCMEEKEIWHKIFPEIEPDEQIVNKLLYDSVFR